MKKNTYWIVPLLMVLGLGLSGCTDRLRADRGNMPSGQTHTQTPDDGEWTPYTIEFNASDMITPSLRSLTEEGENDIQGSVRVLVFDNSDLFAYEAPVTSVTPGNTGKKATGKVQLLLKNTAAAQYKFVMLANLPANTTPDASGFSGQNYAEVMKQFTYTMPQNGEWGNGHLPMWGEITAVVNHNSGANPQIGTIKLIRAVARIDVGLNLTAGTSQFNETASGITGITLTSVDFFNMNQKGTIAPEGSLDTSESDKPKVTTPTLPNPAPQMTDLTFGSSKINGHKLPQRSVYVPEASNDPTEATHSANGETLPESDQDRYLKRPYMVVGLTGADKRRPTQVTYFRIDFLKKTGDEATATYEYLHLLRNYRYLVNITNVGGPGFDSKDDAKKGPAANIMYNVVVWNESDMTKVKYDGQYMLGVSEDHFKFYRDGGEIKAKIKTTWPKGLDFHLPEWIETEEVTVSGGSADERIIVFKAKKYVETVPRKGSGYVQAGRIRWDLSFDQTSDINLDIHIFSDPECTNPLSIIGINQFGKKYGTTSNKTLSKDGTPLTIEQAQGKVTFYVKVSPGYLRPHIDAVDARRFEFSEPEKLSGGVWKYTVTAPDVTENAEPFDDYHGNYDFTITHPETHKSKSASLYLQQVEKNAIPFYDKTLVNSLLDGSRKFYYIMDGKDKSYWVKANTKYKIELLEKSADNGEGDVISSFTNLDEDNPSLPGKKVDFQAADDLSKPKLYHGRAKFRISSPSGYFPDHEFYVYFISAIIQPEANTYMIKAGSDQAILIPVSRVNTAADYYDKLLKKDANISPGSTNPYPLPTDVNNLKLNRLGPDDDWSVNIVWTDIHDTDKTSLLEQSGLKILDHFGGPGPNSYILVKASDKPGNVLVQIRSGSKADRSVLWSWHIWILDSYPTIIDLSKANYLFVPAEAESSVHLMSHLLGAKRAPTSDDSYKNNNIPSVPCYGMMYQWGRKDPFPSYNVNVHTKFYDGEGHRYFFEHNYRGDRADRGATNPAIGAGAVFSMKQSIENPAIIVAHQSMWCFDWMPFGSVDYFYKKWTFRYPWNRPPAIKRDEGGLDPFVGKTVFDPSPYGFRIMNQAESITLRYAYFANDNYGGLPTPVPGFLYDGDYTHATGNGVVGLAANGGPHALFAVCQSRYAIAGSYLVNSVTNTKGSGWTFLSNTDSTYKRAFGFSVRPVVDDSHFGDPNHQDYKVYLPK